MKYLVGKPNIANRQQFEHFLSDILDRGVLTNNGKYVSMLEEYVKDYTKSSDVVAVCNATQALEILLSTLPKKSYVITPAFSFIATTSAILRNNLTPLFVDLTDDFKMDLNHLKRIIADFCNVGMGISAILPVNLYGGIDYSIELKKICLEYGIKLFYDSAHSLGSVKECLGDVDVYSLHATKLVNGFEGGLLVTNDSDLATRLRQIRNFNYIGPSSPNPEGDFVRFSQLDLENSDYSYGTNVKLSEVHAAMALSNMYNIDYLIANNKSIYFNYVNQINLTLDEYIVQDLKSVSNYSYVVCRHPERDLIVDHLGSLGIQARKYFSHLTCDQFGYSPLVPNSKKLVEQVFCLPTGLSIKHEDVTFIASSITSLLEQRKSMQA